MKSRIFSVFALSIVLASCSTAYRQAQTPDDVYFSPGKEKGSTYAAAKDNRRPDNYSNRSNSSSDYDDYTSSNDDQYLRMKIQNRYRWGALDDYDYWYSPGYAYNNYYGYNSFNPLAYNSWGLNLYYSPFASIQPYGWFNSYYPAYGYNTSYGGYYAHNNYGYGYSPVFSTASRVTQGVHRPMLGGYVNNGAGYNNTNSRSRTNGRYVPGFNTGDSRYGNINRNNNSNNNFNNNNNNNNRSNSGTTNTAPVRSFTPSSTSSSGSSSSSGGGVTRQPRH